MPAKKSASKPAAQSMGDLLASQPLLIPRKGNIIDATIIDLSKKGILFDIGWKSYAVLGNLEAQELSSYLPYMKVSDKVPVRVVVEESKEGYPVVSMRAFFDKGKWSILEEKQKNEEDIKQH